MKRESSRVLSNERYGQSSMPGHGPPCRERPRPPPRTTSTGSTWQASAQNNTGSSKSVTSFAYCLQNTNYTFSQASGTLQSDGSAGVSCGTNGPSLGGGFGFPRLTAYKVWTNQLLRQSAWWVQMDPPPPDRRCEREVIRRVPVASVK